MCQSIVSYASGFSPVCAACGYAGPLPASYGAPLPPPVPSAGPTLGVAIAALLLNVLVWPGLGTLIGGRTGEGLTQGLLTLLGFFLIFTIILIPVSILLFAGMWIWGLVTGVQLVNQANARKAANPAVA